MCRLPDSGPQHRMGFLENSGKACARVDPPGSVNQMAEPSSASDREQAVAAARKRGLTKAELEQRLEAHRIDRHFKAATQVAHAGAIEQAGIIRRLFTERLDAYKWICRALNGGVFLCRTSGWRRGPLDRWRSRDRRSGRSGVFSGIGVWRGSLHVRGGHACVEVASRAVHPDIARSRRSFLNVLGFFAGR